ncbi:MAG: hypothetical protein JKY65_16325, partial [Planctomycetes bacterium]|nr:hypothetical protein [Planctomycetota bacterium]
MEAATSEPIARPGLLDVNPDRDAYILDAALQRGLLTPTQARLARTEADRVQASISQVIRGPLFLGPERAAALEAELSETESSETIAGLPQRGPRPP